MKDKNKINEIWLPVQWLLGHYEISSIGRVKSLKRADRRGYVKSETVSFGSGNEGEYKRYPMTDKNGKKHWKRVHQLVAEAFI